MRMSCNGCRVLRKGCSENCSIRPCLQWIRNAESQANATVFLAKFYGRAGLMSLINGGPEHLRPAIFRSLLYEACGRMVNPVFGAVGLLWSGNWAICQAAVDSILKGCPIHPISPESGASVQNPTEHSNKGQIPSPLPPPPPSALMQTIAKELHKVKTKGRFKQPKRVASESKDLSHLISEAEASQVCNLRGRRCYPGELQVAAEPPNRLVSSDYSSGSEHCDEDKNNETGFQPRAQSAMDSSTEHKEDAETHASPGYESDDREVELELTLCSQSPGEKHSNTCSDHSMPIITYLGLGLIPTMSEAAC